MRAAFSPPPQQQPSTSTAAGSAEKAHSLGTELTENPRAAEMPAMTQPLIDAPAEPKRNLNPSLLDPMDSLSAEGAKLQAESSSSSRRPPVAAPAASAHDSAASEVRRRRLETAPSALGAEDRQQRRRRGRARISPKAGGQRSLEAAAATDDDDSHRRAWLAKNAIMKSGGSGSSRMQGQDSLEVRSVTLANGQKASLILEEGRLQRIVAANGQVAELRWNPPALNRATRPSNHLSVRVHRGIQGPRSDSRSTTAMPATIRRWANSLNSQRLTTQQSAGRLNNPLKSSPSEFGMHSKDLRSTKSMDLSSAQSEGPKRRSFVQSLFSLPTNADKAASQGDMPTILETNREVNKDWNPIHESWLPSTMTTQYLQNEAKPPSGEVISRPESVAKPEPEPHPQETFRPDPSERYGRSLEDRRKMTQSMDGALQSGRRNPILQAPHSESGRRASISEGAGFKGGRVLLDSDPSGSAVQPKKKGFWKALKRILHLPSVSKPRTPRSADASKRGSFAKRFSLSGKKSTFGSFGKRSFEGRGSHNEPRTGAVPMTADLAGESSDNGSLSSRQSSRNRQKSARFFDQDSHAGDRTARSRPLEVAVPATPQQTSGGLRRSPDMMSTPSEAAAGRGDNLMGGASELIDTTELRAALAQRRSARESQLGAAAQGSSDREDKSSSNGALRSRRRRALDLEQPAGDRQKTMMAGKWQKNFTEGVSGGKVDDLLQVSSLQRLARERIVEMEIVETEETFEMVWRIPLNGSASKISKTDRYLKNGEVVEAARRDGRPGVLRSQLTFTPEGHVHIRALQGEPFSAVFHDRIKLSTGGRRIKIEQKFQLLQPGVLPVKHHSIWNRVE